MAESMTYNSLLADVAMYAERNDRPFIDQVPRFVMLAENRIASQTRGLGLLKIVTGAFEPGQDVVAKPARWRETGTFMVRDEEASATFLKSRSYTFCRSFAPNVASTGLPQYYADYGYEHFLVAAKPDQAYNFELAYFERPLPLDETTQTNWTTQYAPQLLLYATLLEAQPFLKLDQRATEFKGLYDLARQDLLEESQRRLFGDQALLRSDAK